MTLTTIPITISSNYVPDWGAKEGLREMLQNFLDAGGNTAAGIQIKDSTITFTNEGALSRHHLLLGETSKLHDNATRGQFGEGLKLGILALLRLHCGIRIETGGELWIPTLDYSQAFNRVMLFFHIQELAESSDSTKIEISGIDAIDLSVFQSSLEVPTPIAEAYLPGETLSVKLYDVPGTFWVGGLKVMENFGTGFGYDLPPGLIKLNRDRDILHLGDALSTANKALNVCMEQNPEIASLVANTLLPSWQTLEKESVKEYQWLAETYIGDTVLTKALCERARTLWPEETIPVERFPTQDRLELCKSFGTPASVPGWMYEELKKEDHLNLDKLVEEKTKGATGKRTKLAAIDQARLKQACKWAGVPLTQISVVAMGERIEGLYIPETKTIALHPKTLAKGIAYTAAVLLHEKVHEEYSHHSTNFANALTEAIPGMLERARKDKSK